MTQQSSSVHTTRPAKAQAIRCVRCGRAIKRDSQRTVLGVVGPDCEQYVMAALNHLSRNGLGELARTGEIRMQAVKKADDTYTAPPALQEYCVLARRVGVSLTVSFDVQTKEVCLRLTADSIRRLLNDARATRVLA